MVCVSNIRWVRVVCMESTDKQFNLQSQHMDEYMCFFQALSLSSYSYQVQTFAADFQKKLLHETDILSSLANTYVHYVCHNYYCPISFCFPDTYFLFFFMFSRGICLNCSIQWYHSKSANCNLQINILGNFLRLVGISEHPLYSLLMYKMLLHQISML